MCLLENWRTFGVAAPRCVYIYKGSFVDHFVCSWASTAGEIREVSSLKEGMAMPPPCLRKPGTHFQQTERKVIRGVESATFFSNQYNALWYDCHFSRTFKGNSTYTANARHSTISFWTVRDLHLGHDRLKVLRWQARRSWMSNIF